MVRYADDFVILVKEGLEEVMLERVKGWLELAGLTLNLDKTKLTNTRRKGKVEFLGFEIRESISPRTGIGIFIPNRVRKRFNDSEINCATSLIIGHNGGILR